MSDPLPAPKDPPLPYSVSQHADGYWLVRRPDGTIVSQSRGCAAADMEALALNKAFREGQIAEREACAKIADEYGSDLIAELIRERSRA